MANKTTPSPQPTPAVIAAIQPDSLAARHGLAPGDRVLRVNGKAPRDYIDYRYLLAEEHVLLSYQDAQGRIHRLHIEKNPDEDLGLTFASDVFDGVRICQNACTFCFVAQLPRGLRPALYLRDDDYRLSFLHGNFITLTNLTPADMRRIGEYHLSPLYVSVHATEPEVRRALFGGKTPDPLAIMRRLIPKGIEFHTQLVICPGINDGEHLARSVHDLAALHPGVQSIGVVPVGLTSHRGKLAHLSGITAEQARVIVENIAQWQREFRKQYGARLVYAADELFWRASLLIPSRAYYENFPQLGNGIGNVRLFLDDLKKLRPVNLAHLTRIILVTGAMAAEMVRALAKKLAMGDNVETRVCVVPNRFFGESVTTAGLLAGRDILAALQSCGRDDIVVDRGDIVMLPETALQERTDFLDGMTVQELAQQLDTVIIISHQPREAAAALRTFERSRAHHD